MVVITKVEYLPCLLYTSGDIYTETAYDIEFELKVKEVDDKKVVFEPVSDMSAVSDADVYKRQQYGL